MHNKDSRRESKRKQGQNVLQESMDENVPNLKNRKQISRYRKQENPKQNKHKQTYAKTYHNPNGKR